MSTQSVPDPQYWQSRWARGETGWHLNEVNPHLVRFWSALALEPGGRVFVPLCGKSLDLAWLVARGHPVLGLDCSLQAAEQLFDQHGLSPTLRTEGPFTVLSGGGLEVAVGDVLDLPALDVSDVVAFYDRAALIALAPTQRAAYARVLSAALPPCVRGLLITLEYPQEERVGPPFSVEADEVYTLFGARFGLSLLHTADVLSTNPGFVAAGVTRLTDRVVALAPAVAGPVRPLP
jgi:thiopurine S-methyltransferase